MLACLLTLPYTFGPAGPAEGDGTAGPRYNAQDRWARLLPPSWAAPPALPDGADLERLPDSRSKRLHQAGVRSALRAIAAETGRSVEDLIADGVRPTPEQVRAAQPVYLLGTDILGRSLLVRCLAGGGISLGIGLAAAALAVCLGTIYGTIAAYAGGRVDAAMMRTVDVLYGLPYILLVVLLAVAVDAVVDRWQAARSHRAAAERAAMVEAARRAASPVEASAPGFQERLEREARAAAASGELSAAERQAIGLATLLVAIGGVSWLTMARVVRGQVLSLKARPFVEAARAIGASPVRVFLRHLLPNLLGTVVVYATLAVPQAILQESFLSFLGIGVRPPLPSWGNLAAEGLAELNPYSSNWWLLLFPCLLLAGTLLALNLLGEGLRAALDPGRPGEP